MQHARDFPTAAFWDSEVQLRSPYHCTTLPLTAMATSVGINHRKSKTASKNNGDVIAAAVQAELSHVAAFEGWLLERIKADGDGTGVLARVQEHLLQYKLGLLESTLHNKQDKHLGEWSMHVSVHDNGSNGLAITVTVPGSLKPIEIVPKDNEEATYLMSVRDLP